MNKYRIAEISVSEDGKVIWIGYYGLHADQGGNTFRWGELGVGSIEDALSILNGMLPKGLPYIRERLEDIKEVRND
jgi:hypothetical protein